MEIYININGVLRNFIQKFEYHYKKEFQYEDENAENNGFDYNIIYPINNDKLLSSFKFHSKKEFENFIFVEFPLEIFGHAGISYLTVMTDLNRLMYENPQHNFTVIGIDEMGKSRPATLFFLSKNGFLGNNIKFIRSDDIKTEWEKCDLWITDSKNILKQKPSDKKSILFETDYNKKIRIDKKHKIKTLKNLII